MSQQQTTRPERRQEQDEAPAPQDLEETGQTIEEKLDELDRAIEEALGEHEENAEEAAQEFVHGFVQKGGE